MRAPGPNSESAHPRQLRIARRRRAAVRLITPDSEVCCRAVAQPAISQGGSAVADCRRGPAAETSDFVDLLTSRRLPRQKVGSGQNLGMEQPDYLAIEERVVSELRTKPFVKVEDLKHGLIPDPEDLDLDCAGSFDCARITILNKGLASKNAVPKEGQTPADPEATTKEASTTKGPINSEKRTVHSYFWFSIDQLLASAHVPLARALVPRYLAARRAIIEVFVAAIGERLAYHVVYHFLGVGKTVSRLKRVPVKRNVITRAKVEGEKPQIGVAHKEVASSFLGALSPQSLVLSEQARSGIESVFPQIRVDAVEGNSVLYKTVDVPKNVLQRSRELNPEAGPYGLRQCGQLIRGSAGKQWSGPGGCFLLDPGL